MYLSKRESMASDNMRVYLVFKRGADIILSILALIILSPVFLCVLCVDRFGENKGAVFYKQVRVGLHGKRFKR